MCSNDLIVGLAAGGPALVLSLAITLAAWAILSGLAGRRDGDRFSRAGIGFDRDSSELKSALDSAVTVNSFDVSAPNDPGVHLGSVFRMAPREYLASVAEVAARFAEGRVLSVDLANMEDHQAARFVDFCSGVVAARSGWIFRVTEKVIILTPVN